MPLASVAMSAERSPASSRRALAHLELEVQRLPVLDREPAVVADGVDGVGDQRADLLVAGGDRATRATCVAVGHRDGLHVAQVRDDLSHGEFDAAPQRERVRARGDVAQPVADERLGEHGRGRRAVAGDLVGGRATCRTSRAPERSNTAPRSIPAAIVAPSLVIVSCPCRRS